MYTLAREGGYTAIMKYQKDILILLVIFVVAFLPRVVDLGVFLTADEKNWIGRSYEFVRAFKDWRFNDMLQTTHPGVPVLWVVGAAVTARMLISHIPFSFDNLAYFVTASQLPVALINALIVPLVYLFLRVLLKRRGGIPLIAALLIALDPVLIGYSRVVHVDALLAGFLFLAALATLIYARRGYDQRWLMISGAFGALAILTKIPGIFIVPFFWLVLMVQEGKAFWRRDFWLARARDFVVWILLVVLLIVLLWPALIWVPDQQGNVLVVKRDLVIAAGTPHDMTDTYKLAAWHYPATLLTRSTPVALVFAVIATLGLLVGSSLIKDKRVGWLMFGFILFFMLMMTLGAKKGDRYVLPVFLALDFLAAAGIWMLGRRKAYILAAVTLIYLGVIVVQYHPYAIAYNNPLFADNLSQELGWGEGLEQVGKWLSENDPEAVVASWYPQELQVYTSARVAHINAHEQGNIDYVVLYRNMFGREPAHYANDFIDEYYKKREPVFVARVVGKEFAWVYNKPVYKGTVGELLPGKTVGDELEVKGDKLLGVDVLVATYSGRASAGELVVKLTDEAGKIWQTWRRSVAQTEDDQWLKLKLDEPLEIKGQKVVVEISAEGTADKNAPTIRSNEAGRLGIRGRYLLPAAQEALDEHTKLLPKD